MTGRLSSGASNSLASFTAEPSTPRRAPHNSSPSTPLRSPPSTASTPTPNPNNLHAPPITTNGNGYSPLQAFFGTSPTPSTSSTFAPSSPSPNFSTLGGGTLQGIVDPETPPTPPLEEDPFGAAGGVVGEKAAPKLAQEGGAPMPIARRVEPTTLDARSITRAARDEAPAAQQQQHRPSQEYQRTRVASQNLQESVARPSMESGRSRISMDSGALEQRVGGGRSEGEESARSVVPAAAAVKGATERPSTPPISLQPSLPVSPPSPSSTAAEAPSRCLKSPARAPLSQSTTPRSPPTSPSRTKDSKPTPRATALAKARERSESASPSHSDSAPPRPQSPVEPHPHQQEGAHHPRPPRESRPLTRLEHILIRAPRSILKRVLAELGWGDFCALRVTSRGLKRCVEGERGRELVLQRFLGGLGYRTLAASSAPAGRRTRGVSEQQGTPTASDNEQQQRGEPLLLTLRDSDAFLIGVEITLEQYARFALDYAQDRLHPNTLRLIRASTRAWNRVVLRLRAQSLLPSSAFEPYAFAGLGAARAEVQVYKKGRAAGLRVWVPMREVGGSWMGDEEVVECEREVWRCGGWREVRKGDVVANVAVRTWGNLGKLIQCVSAGGEVEGRKAELTLVRTLQRRQVSARFQLCV